jgi:elongator complex protein 3
MKDRGVACKCIRCREAGEEKFSIFNFQFSIIKYKASGGEEFFLQATNKKGDRLYGFCRLRLKETHGNASVHEIKSVLSGAALIRELHVYGELVSVGVETRHGASVQHEGLGKRLMSEAEKIARKKGFEKIAVIAGVGVRGYYRKLGYKLKDSYMVKNLV